MKKYPLANSTWDHKEIEALNTVIESGMFTMGDKVRAFEEQFAQYTGTKYSVMVNSGSSANLLMVASLFFRKENPLQIGDEVIVPAVSWATTYYPLNQYGLKIKFVDVDLETLNFDLHQLERAVTAKTRMIVAVNLLGNPNEFDALRQIIGTKDIILVEDNCESMGAEYNNKQAGTFGIMGTFSSFFSHHISTMEGGMIVTDDEELHHILLSLRSHGWTRNLPNPNKVTGAMSHNDFYESFNFVLPGYNVRPIEMMGALGLEQLEKLRSILEERRKNSLLFKKLMKKYPFFLTQKETGSSSWFGFSLILMEDAPFTRDQLVQVFHEKGIDCRPIVAGNFVKNPVIKWFKYEICGELRNAEKIDQDGLFLGNHHYSLNDEFDYLDEVLQTLV